MNKNFTWMRDYYARGEYGSALRVLVGRAPNWSWDLLFGNYDEEGFDKHQTWSFNPKHPMFWRTIWREPFHFFGGAFVTLPFLFTPACSWIMSMLVILAVWVHEMFGDAVGHPDLKNLIDWACWSSGSIFVSAISLLLFGPDILR